MLKAGREVYVLLEEKLQGLVKYYIKINYRCHKSEINTRGVRENVFRYVKLFTILKISKNKKHPQPLYRREKLNSRRAYAVECDMPGSRILSL